MAGAFVGVTCKYLALMLAVAHDPFVVRSAPEEMREDQDITEIVLTLGPSMIFVSMRLMSRRTYTQAYDHADQSLGHVIVESLQAFGYDEDTMTDIWNGEERVWSLADLPLGQKKYDLTMVSA